MQIITSTQNKRIKERAKLLKKKDRDKTGYFLVEGSHMIQEALQAQVLDELYVAEGSTLSIDFPQIVCTQPVINRLSHQQSDAKYIGVCHKVNHTKKDIKRVLLLDDVQDPGNVGTIFRTAYSFGYDKIFLSKHCADVYNPKTIQSTQGSLFHLDFAYVDLMETIKNLQKQNIRIFGSALHKDSQNLQDIVVPETFGIVLGHEGHGICDDILNLCDQLVHIEMEQFESLNVAVAAAILCYVMRYNK